MLRRKNEIGKTQISKRVAISAMKMKLVKEFLREYFDVMDVPDDEDNLIRFIVEHFDIQKKHYEELYRRYEGHNYPDKSLVYNSIQMMQDILNHAKDNIALIDRVLQKKDDLLDNHDDMQRVESFFSNQVTLFDAAVRLEADLRNDLSYMAQDEEGNKALNQIRLIVMIDVNRTFDYKKIPLLNELMAKVKDAHDVLLVAKRKELLEIVQSCMAAIHSLGMGSSKVKDLLVRADAYYDGKKKEIEEKQIIALLDAMIPAMWQYKDRACEAIEGALKPEPPKPDNTTVTTPPPKKLYKAIHRQAVFPTKTLESEEDIDAYVEKMRDTLKQLLKNCDGIKLN